MGLGLLAAQTRALRANIPGGRNPGGSCRASSDRSIRSQTALALPHSIVTSQPPKPAQIQGEGNYMPPLDGK